MEGKRFLVRTHCATYNQEHYIKDALQGFVMQETTFPVVYTILDDASTDRNPVVIREFVNDNFNLLDNSVAYEKDTDYGHVTFAQHKTNKNCYFAVIYLKENLYRQKKSKAPYVKEWDDTKYIALCEGDDYWTDPLKLQKQVDFLEEHEEYGFVGTNVRIKKADSFVEEPPMVSSGVVEGDFELLGDVFEYAKYGPLARTVSLLYRRELVLGYDKIGGDLVLESILAKHSKYAFYRSYACVYRTGVGISAVDDSLEKALWYNDWFVNCRRQQNLFFPDDCNWSEDELDDRGGYIRIKYAIKQMSWKQAIRYKKTLKSNLYRNKPYSRFLWGPVSCLILRVMLKHRRHE